MNQELELKDYAHLYATNCCQTHNPTSTNITNDLLVVQILTKYNVSKGIKRFGNPRVNSVLQELKKVHGCMVMDPNNPDKM